MINGPGPVGLTAYAPQSKPNEEDSQLRKLSKELEATFLAEMLKSAGFGKARDSFGGGVGEEQYASFLLQNQAKSLVDAGGIGLSEHLFNALKERSDG